jgi:uracil DNA glycosylase
LERVVLELRKLKNYLPKSSKIFRAFREVDINEVQYVLLGMDPYNNVYKGEPSACGLSFVTENGYVNPSLKILSTNLGIEPGEFKGFMLNKKVLLLNAYLTVEEHKAGSHKYIWKRFTEVLVTTLSRYKPNLVWILLGNDAKYYAEFIVEGKVRFCVHPSYLHRTGITMYAGYQRLFKELNWI